MTDDWQWEGIGENYRLWYIEESPYMVVALIHGQQPSVLFPNQFWIVSQKILFTTFTNT